MKYATICSGIEAPSVAWHPLGWAPVFFSEIEKFPSAVLHHHYPDVPNLGDMTKINGSEYHGAIDLICGGTPCQAFSVAGLRKGLADPRGNLALVFLGLVDRIRPRWIVWENVPGVLSSNKGRDFGAFLGALGELGYGFAYRILDAQYFGVPQRRRRVFVVAHLGSWQPAAAVLFEPEGLRGDPCPSRQAGEVVAALTASCVGTCGADDNQAQAGHLVGVDIRNGCLGNIAHTLQAGGISGNTGLSINSIPHVMATGQGNAEILRDQCPTLNCNHEAPIVFDTTQITSPSNGSKCAPGQPCHTLNAHGHAPSIAHRSTVRRLTPMECERLQGFPDNYTKISPKTGDGPRYKACGNSMAVPVMQWIGTRIDFVNKQLAKA